MHDSLTPDRPVRRRSLRPWQAAALAVLVAALTGWFASPAMAEQPAPGHPLPGTTTERITMTGGTNATSDQAEAQHIDNVVLQTDPAAKCGTRPGIQMFYIVRDDPAHKGRFEYYWSTLQNDPGPAPDANTPVSPPNAYPHNYRLCKDQVTQSEAELHEDYQNGQPAQRVLTLPGGIRLLLLHIREPLPGDNNEHTTYFTERWETIKPA